MNAGTLKQKEIQNMLKCIEERSSTPDGLTERPYGEDYYNFARPLPVWYAAGKALGIDDSTLEICVTSRIKRLRERFRTMIDSSGNYSSPYAVVVEVGELFRLTESEDAKVFLEEAYNHRDGYVREYAGEYLGFSEMRRNLHEMRLCFCEIVQILRKRNSAGLEAVI